MKKLGIALATLFGICLAYVVIHGVAIEVGQEIVILHKPVGDGEVVESRLWIVDGDGRTWLHHGYADSPWIQEIQQDPIVVVERGGETRRYRAVPDPTADPEVHRLLREKYGFADRLVRFWAGTDTETGFATRDTCQAVPVRLEAS
jgi:hypothetical protein